MVSKQRRDCFVHEKGRYTLCSPCTGKGAPVIRAQLDPPRGRASLLIQQKQTSTLELVTSVSGAESLFSRAIRKKHSGSDWKTFIKLFMSTRESCLVAAASPFASVIFGSALGLCSSLAQKCIYKLERSTTWRGSPCVWEAASLWKTLYFDIINCWVMFAECSVPCICWLCITKQRLSWQPYSLTNILTF